MCVKEFFGYSCGHCSVPVLRPCPLSWANEHFPPCSMPAERPIFTEEYCHPCARVIWNANVLREEEEHRERHRRLECECEVVFDQEERERRGLVTNVKGKGKDNAYRKNGVPISPSSGNGHNNYDHPKDCKMQGENHHRRDRNEDWHATGNQSDQNTTRTHWAPKANASAHQYHGYKASNLSARLGSPYKSHPTTYPSHSHNNNQNLSTTYKTRYTPPQILIGNAGAGMRWYNNTNDIALPPQQTSATLPQIQTVLPPLPPPILSHDVTEHAYTYTPSRKRHLRPRAFSEPGSRITLLDGKRMTVRFEDNSFCHDETSWTGV